MGFISIFRLCFFAFILKVLLICLCSLASVSTKQVGSKRRTPERSTVLNSYDDAAVRRLAAFDDIWDDDFNRTLNGILIPRAVGSPGHDSVRQFILKEMNNLGWHVEEDQFTSHTIRGMQNFSNIIATADPEACLNLVLACHYDSKYIQQYEFFGATDSAVPCAIMIHIATFLNSRMKRDESGITLQLIFFDGEEAFKIWTASDSLYGSRHLVKIWSEKKAFKQSSSCIDKDYSSYLDRIDVMILLDLIGEKEPSFFSHFSQTNQIHMQLVNKEQRLNSLKLMEVDQDGISTNYFKSFSSPGHVDDDHKPFLNKGIRILHVIPIPFPSVWHTQDDNRENLHPPTIRNLIKILKFFLAEYFQLDI